MVNYEVSLIIIALIPCLIAIVLVLAMIKNFVIDLNLINYMEASGSSGSGPSASGPSGSGPSASGSGPSASGSDPTGSGGGGPGSEGNDRDDSTGTQGNQDTIKKVFFKPHWVKTEGLTPARVQILGDLEIREFSTGPNGASVVEANGTKCGTLFHLSAKDKLSAIKNGFAASEDMTKDELLDYIQNTKKHLGYNQFPGAIAQNPTVTEHLGNCQGDSVTKILKTNGRNPKGN